MSKKFLFFFAIVTIAILLCGCTSKTIDSTVDININSKGQISSYTLTITMSEEQYINLKQIAASKGYSSVREYFLRDFGGENGFFEYNEPKMNSGKKIVFENTIPIDSDHTIKSMILKVENNAILFNDSTFSSDYLFPRSNIKKLDYAVHSPIKIVKTNSNSLSDDRFTASWSYKEDENIPVLYLVTETATNQNMKSPGFDSILAICVLCLIVLIISRKQ